MPLGLTLHYLCSVAAAYAQDLSAEDTAGAGPPGDAGAAFLSVCHLDLGNGHTSCIIPNKNT